MTRPGDDPAKFQVRGFQVGPGVLLVLGGAHLVNLVLLSLARKKVLLDPLTARIDARRFVRPGRHLSLVHPAAGRLLGPAAGSLTERNAMDTTSNVNNDSVTLLQWLDAFARGTTPLPLCPKVLSAQRFLRKAGVVLAWSFTLAMLAVLILGSFITSWCLAFGAFLFGWIFWQVTMVLVTTLGTLAFACAARFPESAIFLVVSPLVNFGYFCAELGLATVEPLLVIPLHVALNGVYLLIVWSFLLRGKRVRYLMEPITSEVIR